MIAVDTNLLIYAHRSESPLHLPVKTALDNLAASGQPWGTIWQCIHEFAAIVTHPKIFRPPTSMQQCLEEIGHWRACPTRCPRVLDGRP